MFCPLIYFGQLQINEMHCLLGQLLLCANSFGSRPKLKQSKCVVLQYYDEHEMDYKSKPQTFNQVEHPKSLMNPSKQMAL